MEYIYYTLTHQCLHLAKQQQQQQQKNQLISKHERAQSLYKGPYLIKIVTIINSKGKHLSRDYDASMVISPRLNPCSGPRVCVCVWGGVPSLMDYTERLCQKGSLFRMEANKSVGLHELKYRKG